MALPLNSFPLTVVEADLFAPDDIRRPDSLLVDYELGGFDLNDGTKGLQVKAWTADVVSNAVRVYPSDDPSSPTTLFTESGIESISLSFDQNMSPVIAYVASGVAKLYWYDPVAEDFDTLTITEAVSPVVCHDDKRDFIVLSGASDVLLFYVIGTKFYYRQQRDRYTIQRELGSIPFDGARIVKAGMNAARRIQVQFGQEDVLEPIVYELDLGAGSYMLNGQSVILNYDGQPMVGSTQRLRPWYYIPTPMPAELIV